MKTLTLDHYLVAPLKAKKVYSESTARWVCNSNEVINLKLVQKEDDLFAEEGYFHPTYTNQVTFYPLKSRSSTIASKFPVT